MGQRTSLLAATLLLTGAVCKAVDSTETYIYGTEVTLTCQGEGVSGDWFLNDVDLNNRGAEYTFTATFESAGTYECRSTSSGSPIVTLGVIVLGQVGVAPAPGTCVAGSTSTSSCSVEVVRGSNLQLCTEHRTHPLNIDSTQTVKVTSAFWANEVNLVGCDSATECFDLDDPTNYSHSGEWAVCLNVINISQSDQFMYTVSVSPSNSYPSDAPFSKAFTFAVTVVDAIPSTTSSPSTAPTATSSPSTTSTAPVLPTPTPSSSVPMTTPPSPTPTTTGSSIGLPSQDVDVIIIGVVCAVLALLIVCAVGVGVGGCVMLRHRCMAPTSSQSCNEEDGKSISKTDGIYDHDTGTIYMTVIPQVADDGSTIHSVLSTSDLGEGLPRGTEFGDASPSSPRDLDSGFQSATETSMEMGEGVSNDLVGRPNHNGDVTGKGGAISLEESDGGVSIRVKRPSSFATRTGESVSLTRKETIRVSTLHETDLFQGGLLGGEQSV